MPVDQPTRIFVDWGSTNFRAFLMEGGKITDSRESSGHGVLAIFHKQNPVNRVSEYIAFLVNQIGDWLDRYPGCTVLMCGAIGSREGWIDTGYTLAPAGINAIAASIRRVQTRDNKILSGYPLYIVSGLTIGTVREGRVDVMRSEEVKSLGAVRLAGVENALLCVPGTHCKWVQITDNVITDFQTILTGELFGLLCQHGALATMFTDAAPEDDRTSFEQGLLLAGEGGILSADLFQLRSRIIRGAEIVSPGSYLSGILIGHEMRCARMVYPESHDVILLTGSGRRQAQYQQALEQGGWAVRHVIASVDAVCAGLAMISEAAGI